MENNTKELTNKDFAKEFDEDAKRRNRALLHMLDEGESNNIFPDVTMTDSEFRQRIINLFLGDRWYVVEPLGVKQINAIAFMEIYDRYREPNFINKITKWFNDLFY